MSYTHVCITHTHIIKKESLIRATWSIGRWSPKLLDSVRWRCQFSLQVYKSRPTTTLPTFKVAVGDLALPAATASSSLRFTVPLLVAEHFRLLVPRCGTACHRRLRRRHLLQPSALDSRRFCSLSHILTFSWSNILCLHTVWSGPSSVLNT